MIAAGLVPEGIEMALSNRLKISLALMALLWASSGFAQYKRTDLVTDSGTGGTLEDPTLVNGWGLVALPATPWWVSDNGTGQSTLYTGAGAKIPLTVAVPAASGGPGMPTGIVGNSSADFVISENGHQAPALFIFATLDGTVSGWNPAVDGIVSGKSHATLAANRSGVGAEYTGLAIASNGGQNLLLAADDGPNRRVDVFDKDFNLLDLGPDAFVDPNIPKNFAPYGIQTVSDAQGNETVWVTYTGLNKAQSGFVAAFTTGGVFRHLELRGPLHSPWGVALAPADFGPLSNALLISNNIPRGRIEAFDPTSGSYLGFLRAEGKAIEVDGIWAIQFGHGGGPNGATNQLFYTAGPNNYANGIFGVIAPD
jgi:uncharacterized protein (TIGR03118 family)